MYLEHRMSALLQLHLHFPLNTWLQYIAQRQLQAETRNLYVLGFGATYIRDFTVFLLFHSWSTSANSCSKKDRHSTWSSSELLSSVLAKRQLNNSLLSDIHSHRVVLLHIQRKVSMMWCAVRTWLKDCSINCIGNPIVEIRQTLHHLISKMGIPILVRHSLYGLTTWTKMSDVRKRPKNVITHLLYWLNYIFILNQPPGVISAKKKLGFVSSCNESFYTILTSWWWIGL